jgi:hypothetical protein
LFDLFDGTKFGRKASSLFEYINLLFAKFKSWEKIGKETLYRDEE